MSVQIYQGNCLEVLQTLPPESVHMVVTSPPYFGLRDYKIEGQFGLEQNPDCSRHGLVKLRTDLEQDWLLYAMYQLQNAGLDTMCRPEQVPADIAECFEPAECGECYVCKMVAVFREVRRVLRNDGICFIVIGDSYFSGAKQNVPSCGISGKVPEDCPLNDSIWNRPCDGCQAVLSLRTFHKGQYPSDADAPNPEHTESGSVRSPKSRFFRQKQIRQSFAAILGLPQKQDHECEPLHAFEESIYLASSVVSPQNDSIQSHGVKSQDETGVPSPVLLECEHTKASLSSQGINDDAIRGLSKNKNDNEAIGGALDSRIVDRVSGFYSCPYLTTTRHHCQFKPKDLIGIPWRTALALQADGWYLRQDVIWAKPNVMPESVTDRCTKAHEYVFLLAKSEKYFYDAEAVKEPVAQKGRSSGNKSRKIADGTERSRLDTHMGSSVPWQDNGTGRNRRSVWTINTKPFKGAHFAVFPPALVEPCILAGCPAGGTVLDPFGGAGTTGLVADQHGREAILIELNPEYCDMAEKRINDAATARAESSHQESVEGRK